MVSNSYKTMSLNSYLNTFCLVNLAQEQFYIYFTKDGLEGASEDNSMLEKELPEEFVSPLTKMERYLNSDIIFNR